MVSCGEASGDLYAGALVASLRAMEPSIDVFGFGGARLARAGAHLIGEYSKFAVTGLSEALSVVPRSWRMLQLLEGTARTKRPDVFVAIDFPDFNFRLLPKMRALGVPVVYYISPQLWAWRPGRMKHLQRYIDKMLVIFPFEAALYEAARVPVEFVGHPLIDQIVPSGSRDAWLRGHGLDPARPVVALLPGSRPNEIHRILPVLLAAAPLIRQQVPGVQFVIARAPALGDDLFADARRAPDTIVATDAADDVLEVADVVVTASGTATVQTALHERPMVIVYRLSPATYAMARAFVRLSTYGMVNLIAGRPVVPELIQDACTPDAVARETVSLLTDRARVAQMKDDLDQVRAALGGPGASDRAARAVLQMARAHRAPLPAAADAESSTRRRSPPVD